MTRRPHLVIINPDSWRGDHCGFAGHPAPVTPVLDAWVGREAVGFTRAFCQNPVCTPSRCSFMTGWYPHVRGHRTMHHMLRPDEPCLLRDLKDAGWHVWWGGKNDLVPGQHPVDPYCTVRHRWGPEVRWVNNLPEVAGWRGAPDGDLFYSFLYGRVPLAAGEAEFPGNDRATVRAACEQIRTRPADQPLCLYLALSHPHPPYAVADPWYSLVARERVPPRVPTPAPGLQPLVHDRLRALQRLGGWDEARWNELRAIYLGMCAETDHWIGEIEQALRTAGIWEDTAVLVFSDHGDFTGDHGLVEKTQNTFNDCLARVPLVVKPPAGTALRAGVNDALVELVDIPATVYELTGIRPRHRHFGRSLLPLVAGGQGGREAVFCEGGRLAGEDEAKELESLSADNTAGLYWPRMTVQREGDAAHGKAVMVRTARHKYVRRLYERDELYDLAADPGERVNRIDDPALAGEREHLRALLLDHLLATADVVPWGADGRN